MKIEIKMNTIEANELANSLRATENLAMACDASINPTDPMPAEKALKSFTDTLSSSGKEYHIFNKKMSLRTVDQSIEIEINDALVENVLVAYTSCVRGIATLIGPAVTLVKSIVRHFTDTDNAIAKMFAKERLGETKVVLSDEHGLVYTGDLSSYNNDDGWKD